MCFLMCGTQWHSLVGMVGFLIPDSAWSEDKEGKGPQTGSLTCSWALLATQCLLQAPGGLVHQALPLWLRQGWEAPLVVRSLTPPASSVKSSQGSSFSPRGWIPVP